MTRLLLAVAALAVLAFLAYHALHGSMPGSGQPEELPPQKLENAKAAAKRIEGLNQQRADEAEQKAVDAPP